MSDFKPRHILGKWQQGFALDLHTLSSVPVGYNEFGHMQFDTKRSAVGELLFRLKFRGDTSVVPELVADSVAFIKRWRPAVDIVVPVPPSGARAVQPVFLLSHGIASQLGIPLARCVTKMRDTPQLKNIYDLDERLAVLDGAHTVDVAATRGKQVLLVDDLFRSGATMNAITTALFEQGEAAAVFAFTISRTRSHQ